MIHFWEITVLKVRGHPIGNPLKQPRNSEPKTQVNLKGVKIKKNKRDYMIFYDMVIDIGRGCVMNLRVLICARFETLAVTFTRLILV